MKRLALILVSAALLAPALSAADIALSDGRVFHDARIASQTPRTVVIAHAGGLAAVGKELLPADLRSQYPIDEAAARAADEREQAAAATARRAATATAELAAAAKEQARQAAAAEALASDERTRQSAELLRLEAMWTDAARRVERHYRERSRSRIQETSCLAQILDFKPVNGNAGPWLVSGTVTITTYERRETSTTEGRGSSRGVKTRAPRVPVTQLIPVSEETKPFQAIYTEEVPEPTLTVTSS